MPSGETEDATRKRRIDPRLRAAKWDLARFGAGVPLSSYAATAVEEFPTTAGPVDYALCDAGRVLGVAEAKKVTRGPEGVLTQAERYSRGLTQSEETYGDGFRVPFLYSSNGEIIWFHDVRHVLSRSREVSAFHTPNGLNELLSRDLDAELAALATVPMNARMRPYQVEANEAVERAIRSRKRKMLLAMATGTGKTLTMVNETYRLMKSGVARRVLFLVDRKALAAQAVRAFASFEAEPGLKFDKIYEVYSQRFSREDFDDDSFDPKQLPASYLTNPQLGQAFVNVSTIQRMTMNLLGREAGYEFGEGDDEMDDDADKLDIPIHAFDLIIADECHRGYSAKEESVWRATLDHFDAVKVGLTATPAFRPALLPSAPSQGGYSEPMIDREDLESLSSAQLHDRAIGSAKAGGDIDWLWHVLGSMPAAEGAIGDLEDSGMDVAATVSAINGYLRADPDLADALRPQYVDYLLEQQ